MRQFADTWTATKKLRRAMLLIAAMLPLTGFGSCPPEKQQSCESGNCQGGGGESGGDSGGSGY